MPERPGPPRSARAGQPGREPRVDAHRPVDAWAAARCWRWRCRSHDQGPGRRRPRDRPARTGPAVRDDARHRAGRRWRRTASEAVALTREHEPDIVLMDLSMPVLDGVAATAQIVESSSYARVVVLTSFGDETRILDALNAGACRLPAQAHRPGRADRRGPRGVRRRRPARPARRAGAHGAAPAQPAGGGPDQARARGACAWSAQGLANKQIARRLGITERTVKAHLTSVFQRIGVTDRVQAALWVQHNLPPERD